MVKFDRLTGEQIKKTSNDSFTTIFANHLIKQAKKDQKIIAITAAMPDGTGLNKFAEHFPDRYFDVGIAEQHAVTFAAGLACEGLKPFVAIYSTFLQRSYDQIVHDVAIQNLPVRFAIDRAGYVGSDGATHAGSFDLGFLCNLPNFVVMSPSDDQELINMVYTASLHNDSPIAFRYPRGSGYGIKLTKAIKLEIGKARIITSGEQILILSLGTRLKDVLDASEEFSKKHKFHPTIIDMRFAKPIDKNLIMKQLKTHKTIITVEDGSIGGFSSQVNNLLHNQKEYSNLVIKNKFFPDCFIDNQSAEDMYNQAQLDKNGILALLETIS